MTWKRARKYESGYITPSITQSDVHGRQQNFQIFIQTTGQCTALQWLTPEQTSNRKHPYMCELSFWQPQKEELRNC
jgi:leukotriene-A4 hydrolase